MQKNKQITALERLQQLRDKGEWHLLKGYYSINSPLMPQKLKHPVIPAQTGIQWFLRASWIPACAGMTKNPDDCT